VKQAGTPVHTKKKAAAATGIADDGKIKPDDDDRKVAAFSLCFQ
jgi:hypothetical protein